MDECQKTVGNISRFDNPENRMKTEDSALVYFILESHEGICSYSTLPHKPGDAHRDLVLRIPPGFEDEVARGPRPFRNKKSMSLPQQPILNEELTRFGLADAAKPVRSGRGVAHGLAPRRIVG